MFKSLLTTLLVGPIAAAVYNRPRAQGQTLLRRHGARGHSLLVGIHLNVQPIIAVTAAVGKSERASAPGGVERILNLVIEGECLSLAFGKVRALRVGHVHLGADGVAGRAAAAPCEQLAIDAPLEG